MPFKANASRRHHIPRQRHRVRNWAEYDAGLRARGSLTVWFTQEAVERSRAETRTTPGGQRTYSDLAITTALTLRAVFRLPLRQTEGLVGSIIHLLGVELAVPDHSTLGRRAKVVRLPVVPASSAGAVELLVDSTGVRLWCRNQRAGGFALSRGGQAMRCDTGMPSRVIRLSAEQATRASVFWLGRVRARRPRPMMVLYRNMAVSPSERLP